MARKTFRNLQKGDRVLVDGVESEFAGFSDTDIPHSDVAVWDCWADLAKARGFKSFKSLDMANDAAEVLRGYGHGHYAVFKFVEDPSSRFYGQCWGAYRFNGRWVYGSSADPARLGEI